MVFSNPGTLGNDGLHSLEQVRKTKVMMERDRATPRTEATADAEGIANGAIGGSADWTTGRLAKRETTKSAARTSEVLTPDWASMTNKRGASTAPVPRRATRTRSMLVPSGSDGRRN